jgi:catechol 2,3-dioxygenase-like lactoylglutathione lyase family enzyme
LEANVEQHIHRLLWHYEEGSLSRRELIGALALLTLTTETASAAGFESERIQHVSIVVRNLERSAEFYQRVLGLAILDRDPADKVMRLKLGDDNHLSLRERAGVTGVDHFAIALKRFEKESVINDLRTRGATPIDGGDAGLHVVDPDGLSIQLAPNVSGRTF